MPKKIRGKKKLPVTRFLGLLGLAVFVIGYVGLLPVTAVAEEGGTTIETCAECHDELAAAFKGGNHFAVKAVCTDWRGPRTARRRAARPRARSPPSVLNQFPGTTYEGETPAASCASSDNC